MPSAARAAASSPSAPPAAWASPRSSNADQGQTTFSRDDLFARLEKGHAAGVTVVTPNIRLARALVSDFDSFQTGKGLRAWEAPDILPFGAFVERLYEEALYSEIAAELPRLLTSAQEHHLWQEVIGASRWEGGVLVKDETAAQCREAWRLVHAWRIGGGQGNEDAIAFNEWASAYRKKASGETDAARLADLVAGFVGKLEAPRLLVPYAFDILPLQTQAFFDVLAKNGCEVIACQPEKKTARVARISFPSAREELEAAASWARARLEAGRARIGVVVPDLQQRRREVVRVFARVMGTRGPFNVSLGQPLSDYPIVGAALTLLELSHGEIPFARASSLVRSPFIGDAEREMGARARLDVSLRRRAPASVSAAKLLGLIDACPALRALLERVFAAREKAKGARTSGEWARHFSELLEAAGFPGERALDSDEFQVRAKWHEALGELAKLERVSRKMDFARALAVLERLCRETLFQPESPDAPVQVLGILESAGLAFDCLWVSGLTDGAWPLDTRPNPFIPIALQKKAGIPQVAAESSLALDRRITEGWLGAADEVVLSHPASEGDRELAPSPLILKVPEAAPAAGAFARHRDLVFAARSISALEDTKAPAVASRNIDGGTRVLADQAACPFRAFARWRLRAEPLEAPAEELDAADRGKLLHALMAALWQELETSAALVGDLAPAIGKAAAAAVKELGLEGRFAELERVRLARLAADWLEVEKARKPFEVMFTERKIPLEIGGLELQGRVDRMDRLLDGSGHVLIDYKTGGSRPTTRAWDAPRPDDPQLPIYAVSLKEPIAAVAFARLRAGDMRYVGLSRDDKVIEGVRREPAWATLTKRWKKEAEVLGAAFARGEARVDPKKDLQTCRNCALHTLCRVYEKVNVLIEVDESEP